MRFRNYLSIALIYVAVFTAALVAASTSSRAQGEPENAAPGSSTEVKKVYFSLSTNRTYSTADRTRVWINYGGVDSLDFRVYRVADPVGFFRGLDNPHKVGERETREIVGTLRKEPATIEKLRSFKVSVFKSLKAYFRTQLKHDSRVEISQKFRGEGDRVPLNVADYARVPLLNPDQLFRSWRERLTPLDNEYDTRIVLLGKCDPGVYLVEAVNGDLRAYTIAVVTDMTMITKTSPSGEMVVFCADRKSGTPRQGAKVDVVQKKKAIAKGTTDANGVVKTHVEPPKPDQVPPEDVDDETPPQDRNSYLVMARDGDHFAVSDLAPYYFGQRGEYDEERGGEGESSSAGLIGYIYTDRPVYRPAQKVYFRGLLRQQGEGGYRVVTGPLQITIEDANGGKVLEKEMRLSERGTFAGEIDIAGGAALG